MELKSTAEVFQFAKEAYPEAAVVDIEQLAQAGSDRIYYRIKNGVGRHIIATQSLNISENETFISLANYFAQSGILVPQILAVHADKTMYLQSDAGTQSLLDVLIQNGHIAAVEEVYKEALKELIQFQLCGQDDKFKPIFDELPTFGSEQILYDLHYFKNNFALKADVVFDDEKLEAEFVHFAQSLDTEKSFFMYRDCQGRNIMIENGSTVFIDFQGGMQGHPMYDVASLLWQAKAQLPHKWRQELVDFYLANFEPIATERGIIFDKKKWQADYKLLTLTRLLQVLGAYGLRGLVEGKEHFKSSIPLGLQNIAEWLGDSKLENYPELTIVLEQLSMPVFIKKFQ